MFSWGKGGQKEQEQTIDYSKLSADEIKKLEEQLVQLAHQYLNNPDWQQFQEGECNMYSLSFQGRVATKGCMILQFPVNKIVNFLKDPLSFKKTDTMMEQVKVLEAGNGFEIAYIKFKGIWPVAPRDLIIYGIRKQIGDTFYLISRSTPYNHKGQQGIVRAECYMGAYILQIMGPSSTKVTYISDADVKGMIPGFVKNMVSKYQASVPMNLNIMLKRVELKQSEKDLQKQKVESKDRQESQEVD